MLIVKPLFGITPDGTPSGGPPQAEIAIVRGAFKARGAFGLMLVRPTGFEPMAPRLGI